MRILITGGSGFIGRTLCRKLLEDGHELYVLDIVKGDLKNVKYIIGDIIDPSIVNLPIWKDIDVVYHLAAMANVDEVRIKREKAFQVNLHGTYNISETCRENDVLMIMASTACVYGNTPQHPSTEDGPTCPMDLYGVTKRAGEEIVKSLSRWVILRFGTTVGPEMRSALATWIFLNQAHNGEPFTITGNGQQTRNWIFIEDLANGCRAVIRKHIENEIINLVGAKSYTIYRMAEMCAEIVNGTAKNTSWKFLPVREGDVNFENISIEKAMRLLGWKPKIDLKEALEKSYKVVFK